MATTTSKTMTYQRLLEKLDLNILADLLRKLKWGRTIAPIKIVVTSLTAIAAPDVTSALTKAGAVITGIDLATGENLPPVGHVVSCRVTTSGTAASVGSYIMAEPAGTAVLPTGGASAGVGIAVLADAGTTITFPNTITGFTLIYYPRLDAAMTTDPDFTGP